MDSSAPPAPAPSPPPAELPEDASSSEEDESDGEPIVPLLAGREKRSNAGNRMRALLDEEQGVEEEEMFKEDEGDDEFETKDEADVFDSDFGSTDSGGEASDAEAGERTLEREANLSRRDARNKKKRATHTPFLPTFARQTKGAVASGSGTTLEGTPGEKRKKERVPAAFGPVQRESSRKSAVAFKKTVEGRLVESEQRRASLLKVAKKAVVSLTQADLIDEALQTEEINRASLLAFYAAEEDRRAAERVAGMRYEIVGPRVTWISRMEGGGREWGKEGESVDKGKGKEERTMEQKMESGRRRLIEVIGEAGKEGWRPNSGMGEQGAATNGMAAAAGTTAQAKPSFANLLNPESTTPPLASTSALPPLRPSAPPPTSLAPLPFTSLPPPSSTTDDTPDPLSLLEPHSRTYLILNEVEPRRSAEMTALFGSHRVWGSVKVVPSRSRVVHRKIPTCPLTGLPAPYRDPLTLTPFATISAYQTLHRVVSGSYAFHEGVGAFTGTVGTGLEKEERGNKRENPYAVEWSGEGKAGRARARQRKEEGGKGVGLPGM